MRYLPNDTAVKCCTKLVGLLEMGESFTGQELYEKIDNYLFSGKDGELRKRNLMGISSDHASSMISKGEKGATNRFTRDLPHLVVVHDYCHALNLALKDCLNNFPRQYIHIVEQISTHFSHSLKRAARLKMLIQKPAENTEKDSKILAIKNYIPTRWTSFSECLERILELQKPLIKYFEEYGKAAEKQYLTESNLLFLKLLSFFRKENGKTYSEF
jgi:hypothetical protein